MRALSLPLLFALAAAACGQDDAPPAPPPPVAPPTVQGPETQPGVLRVEGEEVPVTLVKVDVPEAPFTTFAPESTFAVTATETEHGFDVRFVYQYAGTPVDEVYAAFVFPRSVNVDSVYRDLTSPDGLLATRDWRPSDAGVTPCLWAEQGFAYRDPQQNATGIVCIGQHRDRPFYLVTHYPVEYGDGFPPRVDVLLDAFRWKATGRPLGGE